MKYLLSLLFLLLIIGCTSSNNNSLANPSATYCIKNGFNFTLINQTGYCVFPDGSKCLSWEFFRGECNHSLLLATTPVDNFTINDINKLGVNCSGSDEEIAECIYDWQVKNMVYTPTTSLNESFMPSYPIRWVELRPDIYTSRDIINNQLTSDGRVYGVCWDFAVVYCSIARYYNLTCRIAESTININNESRPGGMSVNEYKMLSEWLSRKGLYYPYDAVRLTMPNESEMPGHYWAEVKLNDSSIFNHDGWRVMDASNNKFNGRVRVMEHINDSVIVDWVKKCRVNLLNNYSMRIMNGEDLSRVSNDDSIITAREIFSDDVNAGRSNYTGVTDDLGQSNRAASIDDYQQGKGLAPYYYSCTNTCLFFNGTISDCDSECNQEKEFYNCYESCSGEKFYKICDFICSEESDYSSCYELCSGVKLNNHCNEVC